jgi:hypothetical protein
MKTKTLLVSLLTLSILSFTTPSFAASKTNTVSTVVEQVKADVKAVGGPTNLNEVVIGILQGAKTAGGEIYNASKAAIIQSVDFAKEQTPLVVKEFLRWKMAEAILHLLLWSIPACAFFWAARKLRIRAKSDDVPARDKYVTDKGDLGAIKWVLRAVGLIILTINLSVNAMTITKIAIAPRVYLIGYVVDTIQDMQHNNHR